MKLVISRNLIYLNSEVLTEYWQQDVNMGRNPYSKTAFCCEHAGQVNGENYVEILLIWMQQEVLCKFQTSVLSEKIILRHRS